MAEAIQSFRNALRVPTAVILRKGSDQEPKAAQSQSATVSVPGEAANYVWNPTLVQTHGKVRWTASGELNSAALTEPLVAAIARSKDRARLADIGLAVAEKIGVSVGEARSFVEDLIREGLLVVELNNNGDAGNASLPSRFECVPVGTESAFTPELIENLSEAIEVLSCLVPSDDPLRQFAHTFLSRYGSEEIDLGEALDFQYGIDFDGDDSSSRLPILAGLRLPAMANRPSTWSTREALLLRKLQSAAGNGAPVIQLTHRELVAAGLAPSRGLSGAFAAIATLSARSEEHLTRGNFEVFLNEVRGPTGLEHIAYGQPRNGPLNRLIENHSRADEEQAPDAILVAVLQGTEGPGRTHRPWIIACSPDVPLGRKVLPVSDLLVSVIGERVRLFSKRLKREVLPRLVAPAPPGASGVLRFLEAVQGQGTAFPLRWSWGSLRDWDVLPSVAVGRVMLSRGTQNRGWAQGLASELVVPYVAPAVPATAERSSARKNIKHRLEPGSEWLHANVYMNPGVANEVLREVIAPFLKLAISAGNMQRWYFYRYVDPAFHLRLRFCGAPGYLIPGLLDLLRKALQPLLDDRRVWRWSLDTYVREVDRYGGEEGLLIAENAFHADSDAVLELIAISNDCMDAPPEAAFLGTHLLLQDLGLSSEERRLVLNEALGDFRVRFRANAEVAKQLAAKFEGQRATLRNLLGGGDSENRTPLFERSKRLRPLFTQLKLLESEGKLARTLRGQAFSYLHMFLNRLFSTNVLPQELVIYELLQRYYEDQGLDA